MKNILKSVTSKYSKKALLICAAVLLLVITATTAAVITWESNPIKNLFFIPEIENEINEQFDGEEKTSIKVDNTGNTDEYIRVTVVANWKDEDGNVNSKSVKSTDYTLTVNDTDWTANGLYWYHNDKIAEGEESSEFLKDGTKVALTEAGKTNAPDGYNLSVEILVDAIQADPDTAIKEAWGLDVQDGTILFD